MVRYVLLRNLAGLNPPNRRNWSGKRTEMEKNSRDSPDYCVRDVTEQSQWDEIDGQWYEATQLVDVLYKTTTDTNCLGDFFEDVPLSMLEAVPHLNVRQASDDLCG